jgi:hypothetical protein
LKTLHGTLLQDYSIILVPAGIALKFPKGSYGMVKRLPLARRVA